MVEILAVIPARGGSKGIPRKNIKKLAGRPLITYSIAAALQAKSVTRTIVSTDDQTIADCAREFGAEVPFLRPADLARDNTLDLPVFQHAINWLLENEEYQPELIVQLRPTSPFRPPGMIDQAVKIIQENPSATSVRGVVPTKQNPYKMWQIDSSGKMTPLLELNLSEPYNMPRQELPSTYWQTGHIDVIRPEVILEGSMSGIEIFAFQIDPQYSVDLDKQSDWSRAEKQADHLGNKIILPQATTTLIPDQISLLVLDFDGVLTDDRVYVNQHGEEAVAAHRGDGMGISLLKKAGVEVLILSTEKNPVVSARAKKLAITAFQGISEKGKKLTDILKQRKIPAEQVVYVGNDINDLDCFRLVGLSVAVADAHPQVIAEADLVLSKPGGSGAVRELCDLLLEKKRQNNPV
jgi:N-acylneuraminate cytidylyltransferase